MVVRPLWAREGISRIPFRVNTDPEIYASEHERILGWRDDWLEVRVNDAVFMTLRDELTSVFSVGRGHDRGVGVGGSLKFREMLVIYDSELIPNPLVYPL
jgi:3-phenylpropionate/cinnamic acid dioxygenase small subunit